MNKPEEKSDERAVRRLLSHARTPDLPTASDVCPEVDLLAALAEGRVLSSERERLEAHAAACADCRLLVMELAGEAGAIPGALASPTREPGTIVPFPRTSSSSRMRTLAAASILLACGIAGWAIFGPDRMPKAPLDTLARLTAEIEGLRGHYPDGFKEFVPLGSEALASLIPGPTRGTNDVRILGPRGVLLDPPTEIRCAVGSSVTELRVVALDDKGKSPWTLEALEPTTETTPDGDTVMTSRWPASPPIAPGQGGLVKITGRSALGDAEDRAPFTVASSTVAAAWREDARILDAASKGDLRWLLKAQAALQRKLYIEGSAAIREFLRAHPDDALGLATQRTLQALLGETPVR